MAKIIVKMKKGKRCSKKSLEDGKIEPDPPNSTSHLKRQYL